MASSPVTHSCKSGSVKTIICRNYFLYPLKGNCGMFPCRKWWQSHPTADFVFCIPGDAANCPSLDNMDTDESLLFGNLPGSGPAPPDRHRLCSESSCKSGLSSLTMDSEDGYQTCMSEDSSKGAFSRQTSTDDECFLLKDGDDFLKRSSSRKNRNISTASSGSMSPLWESNFSSMFGTLPRKSRKGSVRKQLLKFIPGLHRPVEEEESRFWQAGMPSLWAYFINISGLL